MPYASNEEKKAADRRRYLGNRGKVIARSQQYYRTHRESVIARTKEWKKTYMPKDRRKILLWSARQRAKRTGVEFTIGVDDVPEMPAVCPILGIPLAFSSPRITPGSPSLDRVDNSNGYVKGNVRIISHKANACKSDLSSEQLKRLWMYSEGKL